MQEICRASVNLGKTPVRLRSFPEPAEACRRAAIQGSCRDRRLLALDRDGRRSASPMAQCKEGGSRSFSFGLPPSRDPPAQGGRYKIAANATPGVLVCMPTFPGRCAGIRGALTMRCGGPPPGPAPHHVGGPTVTARDGFVYCSIVRLIGHVQVGPWRSGSSKDWPL
jgi:hypothetical protein